MEHALDQTNLLAHQGFLVLRAVYRRDQMERLRDRLLELLERDQSGFALRSEGGAIYGARNLPHLWPEVVEVWRQAPLPSLLASVLGPGFGLVRVLYFDKPPGQSWALPWHKDLAIAVRNNCLPSRQFGKATTKAGVPHVEAPELLLERMLTLRLHLDDVTETNGPLKVMVGSHRDGKRTGGNGSIETIRAQAGDVLLMRPLLSHCSNKSHPETTRHRRILHFEFASDATLPDGYAWHEYWPGIESAGRMPGP